MKAYWGSGGIVPRILDLCTTWRWVVSFKPLPLYPQVQSLWNPLVRRLGGPQSRSEHGGEEKNSQPLPGLEAPVMPPEYGVEVLTSWLVADLFIRLIYI
jgi:hypothetical protein